VSRLSRGDERVARALDEAAMPADPGVAGLVAVAERLREVGREPRLCAAPDYRAALRERLLAEAPGLLPRPRTPAEPPRPHVVPAQPSGPRHARPPRRRPVAAPRQAPRRARHRVLAAAAVTAVALSGSTVLASSGSLPGDPLYGLKRRVQSVELALTRGDEERGRRQLQLARQRAQEIRTVATDGGSTEPLLATLDDMDARTRSGVRLLATAAVRTTDDAVLADTTRWVDEQRDLLVAASEALRGPARDRTGDSLELLLTASARVTALRVGLPCRCPGESSDELGPLPCGDCDPALGSGPTTRPNAPAPQGSRPPLPAPTGSAAPARSAPAPATLPAGTESGSPAGPSPSQEPSGVQLPTLSGVPGSLVPSAPAPRLPLPTGGPLVPPNLIPQALVGLLGALVLAG